MHVVATISVDREDWVNELEDAIRAAAERNTGDATMVQFSADPAGADLVLCFGSVALASDAGARARIAAALQHGLRVLPIVSALQQFRAEVPPELYPINGMPWANVAAIAEEVLRHLGLTERDRRVFLSYLRRETTPLASQLYDELHRRRFFVFQDTFEIEHGEWVQDRIDQALQHTAFVLLLYSPSVETSEWIEKEINFALAQELGLLALALPGAAARLPFKMTPQDQRIELQRSDLDDDGCLVPTALEKVILAIEREHADQFRSRRERLIADLSAALGHDAIRVGSQSLRFNRAFLRVTPRPPEPRDLFLLDTDCRGAGALQQSEHDTAKAERGEPVGGPESSQAEARVLVALKGGYIENRDLTSWICGQLKHQVRWLEPQVICADPGVLES